MSHNAAGCVLAHLQPQSLVLDLELGQLVLAHEIEDLLQLLELMINGDRESKDDLRIWISRSGANP